jgi:hypothetical protein
MIRLFFRSGAVAVALFWSAGLWAQTPSLSCRPLQPGNTYIDADEKVIGNQACKIVTGATPTQRQPAAYVQPASTPVTPANAAPPVAMSAAPATAQVAADSLPDEAGMYISASGAFTKILGQILDFSRTGSRFVSGVTLHVKSEKENVQILGPHAQTVTSSTPEFYFIPARQEADAGVNAGDFILVHLEEKKERRQIEVGAQGVGRASKGISLTHQIQINRSEVRPGVYKIAPAVGLNRGEYGLYLSRGEGMKAYMYDFSVQ